jgi:RNA recognition motif-containing protein
MSRKVFVGGLPWTTGDAELHEFFAECGEIIEAKVVLDRETGRSRGFGFVTFESPEMAARAVELSGASLGHRTIKVDLAEERPARPGGFSGPPRGERGGERSGGDRGGERSGGGDRGGDRGERRPARPYPAQDPKPAFDPSDIPVERDEKNDGRRGRGSRERGDRKDRRRDDW